MPGGFQAYAAAMPQDARELLQSLVGQVLPTLDRNRPNRVLRLEGANIIVGTDDSPEGEPVALRKVQDGLDILYGHGEIRIEPETFGGYRRSSFIGAVLGTLEGVTVETRPTWVRRDVGSSSTALELPPPRGYPDPAQSAAIDGAGVPIALAAIGKRFPQREVLKMPHTNPGFDVRVLDDDGVTVAYIEIKSTATSEPVFFLSEVERRFAEEQAARYYLVVVTSVDVSKRTGVVHWHDGKLSRSDSVVLAPRQWRGALIV